MLRQNARLLQQEHTRKLGHTFVKYGSTNKEILFLFCFFLLPKMNMATLFGRKIMEDDSHFWPKNKNVIFAVLGVKNKKNEI